MAQTKAPRTESLPTDQGTTFKVGDGVHSGFNGDAYPGTVRKVSASGRQVWVSDDKHYATQKEIELVKKYGQHEGDIDSVFVPQDVPETQWKMYKLNKRGRFLPQGHRGTGWSLQPGRRYAQNPSF